MMTHIVGDLFSISDTCTVYAVRGRNGYVLIDSGTDLTPDVVRAEAILLTHFHRDQCSAVPTFRRAGARVFVPYAERRFFEESDLLRASYDIFDNYTSYRQGFTPVPEIIADEYVHDYESKQVGDLFVHAVPLPGHTFGSTGYFFSVGGVTVLAGGDVLHRPDRLWEYYSTQWSYMDFTGHVNLIESLNTIDHLKPDWVLPGHGTAFRFEAGMLEPLIAKLERLYELFHGRPFAHFRPCFRHVSPSVVEVENTESRTYLVHDRHGHAVAIDCGYASAAPIHPNPHRFVDNLTPHLTKDLGIDRVEWFMCSHYHDDHLAGLPCLQARYGTRVASSPGLKSILEHPERYDMPCLLPRGVSVDRVVTQDQVFTWRGLTFSVDQQPGQTTYNQDILFDVDGKRFMVIGDDISGLSFSEHRDYIYSFIPKNRTPVSTYVDIPRRILEAAPDVLLTGHGGAAPFDERVEKWREWMTEWQSIFSSLTGQPEADMGVDPHWIEFLPYKIKIALGDTRELTLTVTNYSDEPTRFLIRFRSVSGVVIDPPEVQITIPEHSSTELTVTARFPESFAHHSLPILADVTRNDQRLGEIAEAIAYW